MAMQQGMDPQQASQKVLDQMTDRLKATAGNRFIVNILKETLP